MLQGWGDGSLVKVLTISLRTWVWILRTHTNAIVERVKDKEATDFFSNLFYQYKFMVIIIAHLIKQSFPFKFTLPRLL